MSPSFPRGIEVLLKKAAVDEKFRELLLENPSQAAASIELELEPAESAMLQTFPKEHLAAIIKQTNVPEMHRRTFLGKSVVAMLVLIGGTGVLTTQVNSEGSWDTCVGGFVGQRMTGYNFCKSDF